MPERVAAQRFSEEWQVRPKAVRVMIQKLFTTWVREPSYRPRSLSPWNTSSKTRERMKVLREALETKSRGEVVREYAERWELSTEWIDEMITRVLAESQHEIHEQAQRDLARYIARIRELAERYRNMKDFPTVSKLFEQETRLKSLAACTSQPTRN